MIKEVELKYTANNLATLTRQVWGDNATEYLVGRLESVITYKQMKVLIDDLEKLKASYKVEEKGNE
jgi:hypothetical protein